MINLTNEPLLPGSTIGILGAGQLGKMLTQSAQKMGYHVHVFDTKEACTFPIAHKSVLGDFSDKDQVLNFAQEVDSLTYEFENINAEVLEDLTNQDYFIQGAKLLTISKNRLREKKWLNDIGTPTVPYRPVSNLDELNQASADLGLPIVLKTVELGYDGKGQVLIKDESDLTDQADDIKSILDSGGVAEAFCDFDYEASVIVARNPQGEIECFPPTVNIHRAGILCASYSSSQLKEELFDDIKSVATTIAKESDLVGVCGVELFVTKDQELIVNEIAPRPHNSGHYSIEACNLSQFDQHILAITNRELIEPRLVQPTLSVNILGQHLDHLGELVAKFPQAIVHIYDKGEGRTQRKMGHFTLSFESEDQIAETLKDPFLQDWFDQVG